MSAPSELSFKEILKFMLEHNGKVTNHDLVKHFRVFLTDPDTKDEARSTFKKHVNSLASIKNQNNEKWLILKRKYMVTNNTEDKSHSPYAKDTPEFADFSLPSTDNTETDSDIREPPPYRPPPAFQQNFSDSQMSNIDSPIGREYSNESLADSSSFSYPMEVEEKPPKLYPKKKTSIVRNINDKRSSLTEPPRGPRQSIPSQDSYNENGDHSRSESISSLAEAEHKISVKERKQMFNKMASEGDVLRSHQWGNRKSTHGVDEEDRASVVSLDPKKREWIVHAARGDYHALAKMCSENVKYARTKDPSTGYTAMHWACKRGDENLVKMLAGIARSTVNERSNGGYTPLHIAMQFRHENVYKLLVEVYDADPNVRDWSGRKPMQYVVNMDTSLSPDAYRKFKIKADKKHSEKESFLRIGSLNVRVKKTTEAFSNFLGVGGARASAYSAPKNVRNETASRRRHDTDYLHKTWGSADNIPKDKNLMPPPQMNKVRRRGANGRRGLGSHSRSTPTTPDQPRAHMVSNEETPKQQDSDSDTAAGFHAAWRSPRTENNT